MEYALQGTPSAQISFWKCRKVTISEKEDKVKKGKAHPVTGHEGP
jgi:hypothetical protein